MQLPPALRQAIERELEGVSLADLKRAADALSRRYRAEIRDGRLHLDSELAARAYLATRLPATYAAVDASLRHTAATLPEFRPNTMLDVGAGPGTATWAAAVIWPSLTSAELVEASPAIRAIGGRLSAASPIAHVTWHSASAAGAIAGYGPADLVILAYVLDELESISRGPLVTQLWQLTSGVLVIVEPGTTEGWRRILAARDQLIAAGAQILAPCPHAKPCPLVAPDWCHFAVRVARSRLHRKAKGGVVPWEDEKFIYLAASRIAPPMRQARVLAPPRKSRGGLSFKLCDVDGASRAWDIAKRDGVAFAVARRLGWGDPAPLTQPRRNMRKFP